MSSKKLIKPLNTKVDTPTTRRQSPASVVAREHNWHLAQTKNIKAKLDSLFSQFPLAEGIGKTNEEVLVIKYMLDRLEERIIASRTKKIEQARQLSRQGD